MSSFWIWYKTYKFWLIWIPLTILWFILSFCIALIYTTSTRGLAFLLLAPLAVVGLYFASKRTKALESQNEIDSDRLLADTFAKSIELLGSCNSVVRQGAIYALGKIAEDNAEQITAINNILCAFIRNKKLSKNEKTT